MAIIDRKKLEFFLTHPFQFRLKMQMLKMLTMNSLSIELTGAALKKSRNTNYLLLFPKRSHMIFNLKSYWFTLQQMSKLEFLFHSLMDTRDKFLLREKKLFIQKKFLLSKLSLREKRLHIILRNQENGLFRASCY